MCHLRPSLIINTVIHTVSAIHTVRTYTCVLKKMRHFQHTDETQSIPGADPGILRGGGGSGPSKRQGRGNFQTDKSASVYIRLSTMSTI